MAGEAFSGPLIDLGTSLFRRAKVAEQGGLIHGQDPTVFNTADPIRIWVIQIGVIIVTTQILAYFLGKLKQPKVIAEVLGGIILGPTAFGRIPHFTEHVFPAASRPYLSLTATIGLVMFMFIIGLEIDGKLVKRNIRTSLTIALGGIAVSFGLGAAVSIPLYHKLVAAYNPSFPHFLLFVGVSFSITAFPVLCRILTDLRLLGDRVGVVVLSAGVSNDMVGWCLLALCIALVNASSGLTALYVLLVSIGWVLFMMFPLRYAFRWLAGYTRSIEKGPTPFFMTLTLLFVFLCSFMTDIIGVNAIFGAFIMGLIIPREGGLNILITEKLEDLVIIVFLPLYFTGSGLNTNLGLLNTGEMWGLTFMLIFVDWAGKVTGNSLMARLTGSDWREAATIGSLMSCKGLMELIVLNVGLSAGILDTRVFSMFVFEALILTFATTPVVMWLYPVHRRKVVAGGSTANLEGGHTRDPSAQAPQTAEWKSHFVVVLDQTANVPSVMDVTQLIQPPVKSSSVVRIDALRIIELTDRTSDVMRSAAVEDLMARDLLLNIYSRYGRLHNMTVSNRLAVCARDVQHDSVGDVARDTGAQMILLGCAASQIFSEDVEVEAAGDPNAVKPSTSGFFTRPNRSIFVDQSNFIRRLFASSPADVAFFIDQEHGNQIGSEVHLVVPFIGGPDDRLALEFAVQLCRREQTSATVIRIEVGTKSMKESDSESKSESIEAELEKLPASATQATMPMATHKRLTSDIADTMCWFKYAPQNEHDKMTPMTDEVRAATSRMEFSTVSSLTPLHLINKSIAKLKAGKRIIVAVGRGKRQATHTHEEELRTLFEAQSFDANMGGEIKQTLGDLATSVLINPGQRVGLVVMQAAPPLAETTTV